MVALLVTILIWCLVFSVIYWIVTLLPFPPAPFRQIVLAILAICLLLILLNAIGLLGSPVIVIR